MRDDYLQLSKNIFQRLLRPGKINRRGIEARDLGGVGNADSVEKFVSTMEYDYLQFHLNYALLPLSRRKWEFYAESSA